MKKQPIPIFYACDDAFVKYTIVSIKSMITNADQSLNYNIYILNTNISKDMQEHVMKLQQHNFTISFVDVSHYLDSISAKLPIRDYYSKTTYFRLFIAEMYPEFDKAIYIDSDTIIDAYDVTNHIVGAAHEQVMIQVNEYGTYVEEVCGVSRHEFFNAGMLLINCVEFRKQKVLDQFINLLHTYNFVVTQDEDYLNVICKGQVLWVPQTWNTEVFGEVIDKEEDINIFHYIMVSKPWHYHDCRFKDHFWKYAKETSVYDQILKTLNQYTDAQRAEDLASCDRLLELAIGETNRHDTFFKLVQRGLILNVNEG